MKKICFLAFAVLSCVSIFAQTAGQSVAKQSEPDEIAAIILAQNGHSPAYGMSFIAKHIHGMGDAVAVGVIQYLGETPNHRIRERDQSGRNENDSAYRAHVL